MMCLGLTMKTLLIILVVSASLVAIVVSGPIHASCKSTWNFGESCGAVQDAMVSQIKKWKSADGCANGGEKCLYALVGQTANGLTATHTTPVKKYVDDLTFTFTDDGKGGCSMLEAVACLDKLAKTGCSYQGGKLNMGLTGNSRSETWYAVLDYGTNFCNMRNLIDGAGLDKVKGFMETTSDDICTQHSTADCSKY